jgi:hypothetical protein
MNQEPGNTNPIQWKWGALAALAIMILALWPQLNLWIARSSNWQGSYVSMQFDEVSYSAYINSLVEGRPRKNDPYTGRVDAPNHPLPESLFSVQFIPAYAVALPTRLLGVTTSTTFIALMALTAIATSLAIFWLLATVTGDSRLAASGVIFILCLGNMVANQGELRVLLGLPIFLDDYFPFLRRYQPSVSFPLLFILIGSIWQALRSVTRRAMLMWSLAAGLIFAILIFSYFYLWTTAAAWLTCLALLWLAPRPREWSRVATIFGVVGALGLATLVPYFVLLSRRAAETDSSVLVMTSSHAPDFFRVPEWLSAAVLVALAVQVKRGRIEWKDKKVLFTASAALLSFVVFNQQIITGRSLQPLHYEIFMANYVSLLSVIMTVYVLRRGRSETYEGIPVRIIALFTLAVFGWGIVEATGGTNRKVTHARLADDAMPVLKWMNEESKRSSFVSADPLNPRPLVFASTPQVAEMLPTGAPQATLFASHMLYYSGAAPEEMRERLYQYLYYSDTSVTDLAEAISGNRFATMAALFGFERAIPQLTVHPQPITLQEARAELRRYSQYMESFSKERAAQLTLSYMVVPTEAPPNLKNLDRWYERDAGETAGLFTIYRLKLRP